MITIVYIIQWAVFYEIFNPDYFVFPFFFFNSWVKFL